MTASFPTAALRATATSVGGPASAKMRFLRGCGRYRCTVPAVATAAAPPSANSPTRAVEGCAAARSRSCSLVGIPHRLATTTTAASSESARLLLLLPRATDETTPATTTDASATLAAAAAAAGDTTGTKTAVAVAAAEELLKAPFAKTVASHRTGRGLFPWVSSPDLPRRLVPGTPESYSEGMLLGGNLTSSNPRADGFATACFFLRIPFWDMVFFRRATEQDLADSMAWAFGEAVKEITAGGTGSSSSSGVGSDKDSDDDDDDDDSDGDSSDSGVSDISSSRLREMMEAKKLAKLFESASEFGRESLQVKLETKPILYSDRGEESDGNGDGGDGSETDDSVDKFDADALPRGLSDGPKIVSLFVFPYLSRNDVERGEKSRLRKYGKLLDLITASNENDDDSESSYTQSLELSRDLMEDFSRRGISENTVICQVLVPCRETFWVKDTATGKILQGGPEPRTVLHLVRFEQTTKTHIDRESSRFFPFRHELGRWTITDIDDLCHGNLLL